MNTIGIAFSTKDRTELTGHSLLPLLGLREVDVLTQQYLRECLLYDPETGILRWKVRPQEHFSTRKGRNIFNAKFAGKIAGSAHPRVKYLYVAVGPKKYAAHRLIWRLQTGKWPKEGIDHINRNPQDNRWCNLREATLGENQINSPPRGAIPFRGVHFAAHLGKWVARISFKKERFWLGAFDSAEQASAAYNEKAKILYRDFASAP